MAETNIECCNLESNKSDSIKSLLFSDLSMFRFTLMERKHHGNR